MQVSDERKLLIDAVTQLARRCQHLEQRLAAMDERVRALSEEVHQPVDAEWSHRLAQLRRELDRLGQHPAAPVPEPAPPPAAAPPLAMTTQQAPTITQQTPTTAQQVSTTTTTQRAAAMAWPGAGLVTQDRAGLALMGVGAVAVVFAILTQVRF